MLTTNIRGRNSTRIWNLAFKHLYALLFTAERGISRKPTIAILRLTKTATSILELILCRSTGNDQWSLQTPNKLLENLSNYWRSVTTDKETLRESRNRSTISCRSDDQKNCRTWTYLVNQVIHSCNEGLINGIEIKLCLFDIFNHPRVSGSYTELFSKLMTISLNRDFWRFACNPRQTVAKAILAWPSEILPSVARGSWGKKRTGNNKLLDMFKELVWCIFVFSWPTRFAWNKPRTVV